MAQRFVRTARKKDRHPVIQQLLSEGVTDWREIRRRLEDINPAWVTVKKSGKQIDLTTLEDEFKRWLKKQPPPDQAEPGPP